MIMTRYGQLGQGDTSDSRQPSSELTDLGDDFETVHVDCRYDHCCALSSAGTSKWYDCSFVDDRNTADHTVKQTLFFQAL